MNGRVMPRPNSWIATVESSHLPSRGSWPQNDARVALGGGVGSEIIAVDPDTCRRHPSTGYRRATGPRGGGLGEAVSAAGDSVTP